MDSKIRVINLVVNGLRNHQIFAKWQAPNELLVHGIPSYVSVENLKSSISDVTRVFFHINKPGFRTARIKFINAEAASSFADMDLLKLDNIKFGLTKWIQNYMDQHVPEEVLKKTVAADIKSFDKSQMNSAKDETEDENGWQVVKSDDKRKVFKQKESIVRKLEAKLEKDRERGLPNFYANSMREVKKTQLKRLKQKFETDKRKVEFIKKAKRFKPFSK